MKATTKNLLPGANNAPAPLERAGDEIAEDRRKNNGGARIGAGRKPGKKKVPVSFTIEEEIINSARQKHKGKLSGKVEGFLKRISK